MELKDRIQMIRSFLRVFSWYEMSAYLTFFFLLFRYFFVYRLNHPYEGQRKNYHHEHIVYPCEFYKYHEDNQRYEDDYEPFDESCLHNVPPS